MGSYVLATVLLFSLLGCGLSSRVRGAKRPLDFPGAKRDFGRFEYPRKHGFDYPGKPRKPMPTADVEVTDVTMREDELTASLGENPVICEVCKYVVADLQSLLGNDSSKIVSFLASLCAELPTEYSATCKKYVDGWTPYIIDFLENSTPDEICAEITLCTAMRTDVERRLDINPFRRIFGLFKDVFRTKVNKITIRHALGNDYLCQLCDEVVDAVEENYEHVLEEVTRVLEEVCSITPVQKECDQYVKQISAEVKAVVEEYFNNQTCADIGLCPGFESGPLPRFRGFLDFLPDRLGPRYRPDTEPSPRGHPFREHDEHNGRGHRDHHDHHDHHGHRNHTEDRHNHTSSHPHRPHTPFKPFGRDQPHHGHGPVDRPRPDTRWWSPFWPFPSNGGGHNRPTRPIDPMTPLKPNRTSKPEPKPEAPRPTSSFVPVNIDPKRPYAPKGQFVPRLPEDIPVRPRSRFPGKRQHGERKGPRRGQRSVVINSINGGFVDNGYQYDIESDHDSQVQINWQCDTCEYGVEAIQNFLLERAGTFEVKLIRVANTVCHRLPEAIVAECKTEVANVLNGLVTNVITGYVTPDKVCPILKLC